MEPLGGGEDPCDPYKTLKGAESLQLLDPLPLRKSGTQHAAQGAQSELARVTVASTLDPKAEALGKLEKALSLFLPSSAVFSFFLWGMRQAPRLGAALSLSLSLFLPSFHSTQPPGGEVALTGVLH